MDAARKRSRTLIKSLGVVGMAAVAAPPQSTAPLTFEQLRSWRTLADHPTVAAMLSRRVSLQRQRQATDEEIRLAQTHADALASDRAGRMAQTGEEELPTAQEVRLAETATHLAARRQSLDAALALLEGDLEPARTQAYRDAQRLGATEMERLLRWVLEVGEAYRLANGAVADAGHHVARLLRDTNYRYLYEVPQVLQQLQARQAAALPKLRRQAED